MEYSNTDQDVFCRIQALSDFLQSVLPKVDRSIALYDTLEDIPDYLKDSFQVRIPSHFQSEVSSVWYGTIKSIPVYCWQISESDHSKVPWVSLLCASLGCSTLLTVFRPVHSYARSDIFAIKDDINHSCDRVLSATSRRAKLSRKLRICAGKIANRYNLSYQEGTCVWIQGRIPPSELRSLHKLGGDVFAKSAFLDVFGRTRGLKILPLAICSEVSRSATEFLIDLIIDIPTKELVDRIEITPKFKSPKEDSLLTRDKVETAIELLSNICASISIGFVANSLEIFDIEGLEQIPYKSIFPKNTDGKIFIGQYNNMNIVCFQNTSEEGFNYFESEFIVKLLIKLRCGHIHYIVPSCIPKEQGNAMFIDYIDFQVNTANTSVSSSSNIWTASQDSVLAMPNFPSEAEIHLGNSLGATHFTVSDMSILKECSNQKLRHSLSVYSDLSDIIGAVIKQVPLENVPYTVVNFPQRPRVKSISPTKEGLESLCHDIKDYCPKLCVISPQKYEHGLMFGTQIDKSWAFKEGLTQILHISDNVLYILGDLSGTEDDLALYLIPRGVGIPRVLLIDNLASTAVPVGSWFRVTNHLGLSYRLPHCDLDFSKIYENDFDWKTEFKDETGYEGIALFASSSCLTKALARAAVQLDTSVIASFAPFVSMALCPDACYSVQVLVLGHIGYNPVKEVYGQPPTTGQFDAIQSLIERLSNYD